MSLSKTIRNVFAIVLFTIILFSWFRARTSEFGPGGGYTNAPGENNCTTSGCHTTYSLISPSSSISLTSNGSSNLVYKPDTTYTIKITLNASATVYGFEVTAVDATNSKFQGTFTITSSSTQLFNRSLVTYGTRYYVDHTYSGISSNNWSFKWKAPSTNVGDIKFYVCCNAGNGNGQSTGDYIHANVFTFKMANLPVPSISYTPSSPCQGDTVSFSGSATNSPTSWSWTFQNGNPASSNLQNPKVVFSKGGYQNVSLSAANSNGSGSTTAKPLIISRPSDSITAFSSTVFCYGDSVILKADAGDSYQWTSGQTTQAITVKQTGQYGVTIYKNTGCNTKARAVWVIAFSKPIVTLSRSVPSDTVCAGDSVYFTANPGFATYTFYNAGLQQAPVQTGSSNIYKNRFTGNRNQVYVTGSDIHGCSDTSSTFKVIAVPRMAAPITSCGTSTTNSITVTWQTVLGAKAYQVSADSGKTWKAPTGNLSHTESGLKGGKPLALKVRATNTNGGCNEGATATQVCTTLSCSNLSFSLDSSVTVCSGSPQHVIFSKFNIKSYLISLNGSKPSRDTAYYFSFTHDSALHYVLTDSTKPGCTLDVVIPVHLLSLPAVSLSITKKLSCEGEPVTLSASPGFVKYNFYRNGVLAQSGSSSDYTSSLFKNNDSVYVDVLDNHGCNGASSRQHIVLSPKPSAAFSYSVSGQNVNFLDSSTGTTSYLWDFGDGSAASTVKNPVHQYAGFGSYTVKHTVSGSNGCRDSLIKTLLLSGITSMQWLENNIFIYPNPVHENLLISIRSISGNSASVRILDLVGRPVYEQNNFIQEGKNEFSLPVQDLRPGIYYVKLCIKEGEVVRKIIKQ